MPDDGEQCRLNRMARIEREEKKKTDAKAAAKAKRAAKVASKKPKKPSARSSNKQPAVITQSEPELQEQADAAPTASFTEPATVRV